MTNKEWLQSLCNEALASVVVFGKCSICAYRGARGTCSLSSELRSSYDCFMGIREGLNQEVSSYKKHVEPMPELETGDIVVYGGLSYVAISSTMLVCREMGKQYRLEDINSKIKNIQRYNGSTYQCIWRADNEQEIKNNV